MGRIRNEKEVQKNGSGNHFGFIYKIPEFKPKARSFIQKRASLIMRCPM